MRGRLVRRRRARGRAPAALAEGTGRTLPSVPPSALPALPRARRRDSQPASEEPGEQHGGTRSPRPQAQARCLLLRQLLRRFSSSGQQPDLFVGCNRRWAPNGRRRRPLWGPVSTGRLAVAALLHHPLLGLPGRVQLQALRRHTLREHHPRVRPLVQL